jgi:8-oxo-dGTP pyrophosphatase MutT (NUDIX family)
MASPIIPLAASTVVLTRPESDGSFAIYLNRRPDQMDSYGGVYVFPGGRVEKGDYTAAMVGLTRGLTALEAQRTLGSASPPEVCLAHWIAAVRELFEEVGIHFFIAEPDANDAAMAPTLAQRLGDKRAALQRGEIDLATFLTSEGLYCDVGRLRYFFHRITPEQYAVRFDTRFYLAALPPDQRPLDAPEEVSESLWIAPAGALARAEAGDFRMMPPTLAVLRSLSAYSSWEDLSNAFKLR